MEKKLSVEQINHLYFTHIMWNGMICNQIGRPSEADRNTMAGKPDHLTKP
jgi:hypothetical protein